MEGRAARTRKRIRRIQQNLRLTGPIVLLAVGVLLPVLLSTFVGIISLALLESSKDLVLGVLVLCFAVAAVGSGVVLTVLLGRRARTARLQSDLLGNVSHELKTPLAAIRMYAQTLQMGGLDGDPAKQKQCIDTIVRETEWLETMIERLLTWRGAARDRDILELVTCPVDGLIGEVTNRFRRMLPAGEVEFSTNIDTNLPVRHDRTGLASVVLNLLTNAYKYGGDRREISLEAIDENGVVRIAVRDNGIGIPQRELKRILEPFHRIKDGAEHRGSGTGLGLAIVDYMVKAHGGTLTIASSEGAGSTFTVTLPAIRSENDRPS